MKKLFFSAIICSVLLLACNGSGKSGKGYDPVERELAKQMIMHYYDSNVLRNDSTIPTHNPLERGDVLWLIKDKKTARVKFMHAAYLDTDASGKKNTITILIQLRNIKGKDTTYTYFDMWRPREPKEKGKYYCPPPNQCEIEETYGS